MTPRNGSGYVKGNRPLTYLRNIRVRAHLRIKDSTSALTHPLAIAQRAKQLGGFQRLQQVPKTPLYFEYRYELEAWRNSPSMLTWCWIEVEDWAIPNHPLSEQCPYYSKFEAFQRLRWESKVTRESILRPDVNSDVLKWLPENAGMLNELRLKWLVQFHRVQFHGATILRPSRSGGHATALRLRLSSLQKLATDAWEHGRRRPTR